MTNAELSKRHRQSPIVLGWESESLGPKDTLSIVRYILTFINIIYFYT